eukprot:TRINITY_DN115488_c0_g1_i1.p1 TRINITY_DN115488_c0_g1~~TRINITY_DN115488_c0_g1_i1.p1  ORF type:complete len:320 (-),score=44.22 TRINITY_DN115488_c0_g1_i1:125-1084(-)
MPRLRSRQGACLLVARLASLVCAQDGDSWQIVEEGKTPDGHAGNLVHLTKTVTGLLLIPLVIWLYSSPVPVMRKIWRAGTTGSYDFWPYILLVCNTLAWVVFTIHQGVEKYYEPFIVNCYGFVVNGTVLLVFRAKITDPGVKRRFNIAVPVVLLPMIGLAIWSFCSDKHDCEDPNSWRCWWGKVTIAVNCALFFGPLSVFSDVWKSKCVRSMPMGQSVAGLVSSINCCVYFFCLQDMNGLIPNMFGVFLSLGQLFFYLYMVHNYPQCQDAAADAEAAGSILDARNSAISRSRSQSTPRLEDAVDVELPNSRESSPGRPM